MKASMTIISGEALKNTLGDIVSATAEMQAQTAMLKGLADAQKARDNESLWDKMKRLAKIPVYKKAGDGNSEDNSQ